MNYQNTYPGTQGNQMYKQSKHLIQYNSNVSPFDPLGLQGMKYTILEPSKYSNNIYTNQIAYNQPNQNNMNYGIKMNQNGMQMNQNQRNAVPAGQQNTQNKIFNQQAYMKQNIPQQINYNNIQPSQYQQRIQPQLIQQQQINPQFQPKYQNQKVEMKPQGYPSQNPCKKIKIDYNKKNEHFVNRPIYPIRKSPSYPLTMHSPQNQQNQIKNITKNQKLDKGIKNDNNKIILNPKISQKQTGGGITDTKIIDKKLSMIQAKENEKDNEKDNEKVKEKTNDIDIKKSGLTIKKSQMSNITNKLKESKIEEKNNPEAALSKDIFENNSQNNIIQKSISQSVNSNFDANLSHLPTIFSIMKGNSQPLPPLKKNKYDK